MPCYLFSFHAYGSWMPDRKRGYTKRSKRILPPDPEMAGRYRQNMKESPIEFDHEIQRVMIDELLVASKYQRFRNESIGSDPTHLHDLVTWRDDRSWAQLRNGIRSSLTRKLNQLFGRRTWFVDGASRKRVLDRDHYDYLTITYLPDHPGWKWSPQRGLYLSTRPQ
jgi:hypothetical protein